MFKILLNFFSYGVKNAGGKWQKIWVTKFFPDILSPTETFIYPKFYTLTKIHIQIFTPLLTEISALNLKLQDLQDFQASEGNEFIWTIWSEESDENASS